MQFYRWNPLRLVYYRVRLGPASCYNVQSPLEYDNIHYTLEEWNVKPQNKYHEHAMILFSKHNNITLYRFNNQNEISINIIWYCFLFYWITRNTDANNIALTLCRKKINELQLLVLIKISLFNQTFYFVVSLAMLTIS